MPLLIWWAIEAQCEAHRDEVVQLYTRQLVSSVTTYEKNLRGFARVHLKPGESRSATISLRRSPSISGICTPTSPLFKR